MSREFITGLHFYQPPRFAFHPKLKSISTDPENKNWTQIINEQCYKPLSKGNSLDKASFDIYQSLLVDLDKIDPGTAQNIKLRMESNGVGEPFIHPILPDLTFEDKTILIRAGQKRFFDLTNRLPKYFWPPETAIDTETLECLSQNGYEGFICAPEQITQSDGQPSDNQPTLINLPSGRQIIALPFDRPISSQLGFAAKNNADDFSDHFITPRVNRLSLHHVPVVWTDAETFGHHWKQGDEFLQYLLNTSLPSKGIEPISINEINLNPSRLPEGRVNERTSWSCPHGNLIRWSGKCDCASDGDGSWKSGFYSSMEVLNNLVSILVANCIDEYVDEVSENFYQIYTGNNPETPQMSLIAAKISSLVSRTSCATFFTSPFVSGKINLLYAYQSLLFLKEAGLKKEATSIQDILFDQLRQVVFPGNKDTALQVLEDMLVSKRG